MTLSTKSGWTIRFDGAKYVASVDGNLVAFELLSQMEDWLARVPVTLDDWWFLDC